MKILVHDYAGHPFQTTLSRELARRGHEVIHGYFADDGGPKGSLRRADGDPASLSFRPLSLPGGYDKATFVKRRFKDIQYGRMVADFIRAARPDVVISGNTPTESQTHVAAGARAVGASFIYWCQDFYSIAATKLLSKRLPGIGHAVGAYYRHLERKQMTEADGVVLITEDFRPQTRAWGIDQSRVFAIENWGALDEIPQRPKQNGWAREHGLEDKFVYLYSGTLGLKHNPDLLADLARQHRNDPSVRVVAVVFGLGVDRLKAAKEREGLDNLVILPLQPFERFPDVLGSADVFVSVIERDAGIFSVPSKVLSYLCAGRPILMAAPDTNLAAQTVLRTESGRIVEPEDAEGFCRTAQMLYADANLRTRMSEAGREYAERTFDIARVADRFEKVFAKARAGYVPGTAAAAGVPSDAGYRPPIVAAQSS